MVADQMDEAMQEVGGDGFLIALPNVSRKSVVEITDGLVPALQQRGLVSAGPTNTSTSGTIFSPIEVPVGMQFQNMERVDG